MRALPYWGAIDDLARINGQCATVLVTPIRVDGCAVLVNNGNGPGTKPDGENRLGAYILGAAAIVLLVIAAIGFLRLFAT